MSMLYRWHRRFSAIFNDGTMMRPYVVDRIERSNGTVVKQYEPKAVGKPISEKTSTYIQKLMKRVVDDKDGTARMYRMEDVDIIAKTVPDRCMASKAMIAVCIRIPL